MTRLWLPDYDDFIGAGHDRYRVIKYDEDGNKYTESANAYPFDRIMIDHSGLTHPGADEETEYIISFWTNTEVWFEDSAVGRKNRDRLATLFEDLRDDYDVEYCHFSSDAALFDYYGDFLDPIRPSRFY